MHVPLQCPVVCCSHQAVQHDPATRSSDRRHGLGHDSSRIGDVQVIVISDSDSDSDAPHNCMVWSTVRKPPRRW